MSLDEQILKNRGGVLNNSLINIMDSDTDDDSDQLQVLRHSPYQDFDMMSSALKDKKNAFSLLSSNIQGIKSKINELKIFVHMLEQQRLVFSVICLQECNCNENEDISQLQIASGQECQCQGGSNYLSS